MRRNGPSPTISAGVRIQPPGFRQLARAIRRLQFVARQNGEAVEQTLGGGVGLGQIERDLEGIDLADGDRLAIEQ